MDLLKISKLFGKATNDNQISSLLKELGINKTPHLPEGDTDANVDVKELGCYLVFTDDAFYHRKGDQLIGKGPLLLTNVSVYCEPTSDYKAFTSPLPFGLLPSMARSEVLKKIGQPDIADEDLLLDRWTVDGVWVFVNYTDGFHSISNFSLQLPDIEKD